MIRQRRKWRQHERDKVVRNVFEAQMHATMRRQSLKKASSRLVQEIEVDCLTLDLGRARIREKTSRMSRQLVMQKAYYARATQWVPQVTEQEQLSSLYTEKREKSERPVQDVVRKIRLTLSPNAQYRLGHLGELDLALAVPAFMYQGLLAEKPRCSGAATEGSRGVYRILRLLHNSRVNVAPRPAQCYI
ncbi:hypothetical protein CCR75_009063 [Bremia lactucae]|uniref:Uncharacterized protein n=1 Tax=Bremia lactucae TaxID=4779 RepID=A0A976IHF2_BRELC|nr:hypothetical protein CCR75_009063 [Bremia lactucae]